MITRLFFAFALLIAFTAGAQNTIDGIVNNYTPVLFISGCDNSVLQVASSTDFAPGDEVLLIQMKGTAVNLSNTAAFGDITNPGNAGNFELNRIKNIVGNQIQLLYRPVHTYNVNGKVQLVRVPEYDDVTANGLTCKVWDGSTGGVLAVDVKGTLTLLNGGANVSEKGFRGGTVVDGNGTLYHETNYFYAPDPEAAAEKGEGIADYSFNQAYGRGKVANAGGGGNAHNAGGGGGGNAGAGGNGGLEYYNVPGAPTPGTDGIGGLSVFGFDGQKITLGGGGGAGHTNDEVGTSGGRGGGIILLKTNKIEIPGGSVTLAANGENVIAGGNNRNDGQGGGGAGGSILIEAAGISGALSCELKGGRGGDCLFFVEQQIIGPGGGGGGGKLMLSQNFPNVTAYLEGGINGIANQNLTNGAQPGQAGARLTDIHIPESSTPAGIVQLAQTLTFCPGSSVTVNGVSYTQPGIVFDTIAGATGCDTVITYTLEYAPVDLVFDMEHVFCQNGEILVQYSLCNLGSDSLPDEVRVMFCVVNPTTDTAHVLVTYKLNTAGADSCKTGTVPVSGLPITDVLYSVVNFSPVVSTPFSFDDFPLTDLEECNYFNNLDSIAVQLPVSPTLDLGPDIVLCKDSSVVFDAGAGFLKYYWQDGSTASTFTASQIGIYWVEVTDSCGSKQRDSVFLTISLLPDTQFPDVALCPDDSLYLTLPGFDNYQWAPAAGLSCTDCSEVIIRPDVTTTYTLLATTEEGCVLRDTFTVEALPNPTVSHTIELCPGESVTIGGVTYTQPGTVKDTIPGTIGCDTIATYTLILLPQPLRSETVTFCKGESVIIGGQVYTQPGVVKDTVPAAVGCDTIVTYTLQYLTAPNSSASVQCPSSINISVQPGSGPVAVPYNLPGYSSNCPCPGISLNLTEGLAPGSLFPVGTTQVCYAVKDSCGNTASCCFKVTVQDEQVCDVKEIGCMKYELLSIKRHSVTLNLSYRIRVTNKCTNQLIYTAIQLPNGVVAKKPSDNSVYTSPSGRNYDVRNPNFTPFYSVRFQSKGGGIANGESDIFEYTLPPQVNPNYIHITSRLDYQIFYEAHLNTFYCPIVVTSNKQSSSADRADKQGVMNVETASNLKVFPNPTDGVLFADLSDWQGEKVQVQVMDSRGQSVQRMTVTAGAAPQEIRLPESLADGLYFMEILTAGAEKRAARFVMQRH